MSLRYYAKSNTEASQIPVYWRKVNVTPIYKKRDRLHLLHITVQFPLLLFFEKVLGSILTSNVVKHLEEQNVLFGLFHNFRQGPSCDTKLAVLVKDLARKMNMGNSLRENF